MLTDQHDCGRAGEEAAEEAGACAGAGGRWEWLKLELVAWCLWRQKEAGDGKEWREPQVAALAQQCREGERGPTHWATASEGFGLPWEP
eukprot:4130572-Pleurochrysis_carterae.AAC.2